MCLKTKDLAATTLGQELLFPGNIAGFTLTPSVTQQKANALIAGKRQVVASQITAEEWKLSLTFEYMDWTTMQFVFDEIAKPVDSIVWGDVRVVQVPSVAPFEIVDPDITAANDQNVTVYLSSKGTYGKPKFLKNTLAVAPANTKEVSVDGATGKLVFNSGLAGAFVTYQVPVTRTVESIGSATTFQRFGALEFAGVGYTTETAKPVGIVVPQITRSGAPTMTVNGDKAVFTIEFDATVPQGSRSVVRFFNFDTVV